MQNKYTERKTTTCDVKLQERQKNNSRERKTAKKRHKTAAKRQVQLQRVV